MNAIHMLKCSYWHAAIDTQLGELQYPISLSVLFIYVQNYKCLQIYANHPGTSTYKLQSSISLWP